MLWKNPFTDDTRVYDEKEDESNIFLYEKLEENMSLTKKESSVLNWTSHIMDIIA